MHEHHLYTLQEREPSQTKLTTDVDQVKPVGNMLIQRNPSNNSAEMGNEKESNPIVSFGFEISPSLHEIH
jgi:hypothetical protein